MSNIELFKGLRFQELDGEILLSLEDVSRGLGFVQFKNDKEYVRKDRVSEYLQEFGFPTSGESIEMIPESAFYLLAMKANNEAAKKFQIKVATEIIPEFRKSKQGAFKLPKTFSEALKQLADNVEKNEALQQTIEAQKPKVLFADAVSASKTSILVGELAKILKQNGIEMGQNRLFQWLRNNGYLISRKGTDFNMPTQRSMELNIFEIKETSITHSDGHISISKTTKINGKGQNYFINKFLNKNLKIA